MTRKAQMRDRLFDVTGRATKLWPFSPLAARFFTRRQAIVFYHGIWEKNDPRLELFGGVDTETFARDLRRLAHMFRFVGLSDLLLGQTEPNDPRPSVTITFDDGFDLIDSGAADVMESMGVRATAFVNSDSYRYERVLWPHAFSVIKALRGERAFLRAFNEVQQAHALGPPIESFPGFLDATKRWPQSHLTTHADTIWKAADMPDMQAFLRKHSPYFDDTRLKEWARRGHEIGFHGKSHPWSKSLHQDEIDEQYLAPARELKAEFDLISLPFAYPFGDRLHAEREREIANTDVFYCLLGTDRLSRRGESPFEMDRIELDFGLERYFFGRPLIRALRRQDRRPRETEATEGIAQPGREYRGR